MQYCDICNEAWNILVILRMAGMWSSRARDAIKQLLRGVVSVMKHFAKEESQGRMKFESKPESSRRAPES